MTSKERVLQAVKHQTADRIPITFDAAKEVYDALHARLGTRSKEQLFDRLHVDTWMVLPRNFVFSAEEEKKTDDEARTTLWGYKTRTTRYEGGTYQDLCFSPLAGRDEIQDIDKHIWPSDDALDFSRYPTEIEAHKDRAIIGVFCWGAYFIASFVRGMEDLFCDFAANKKYAHHLIDVITERILFFLDKMLTQYGNGIDIVYMADDYCSQMGPLFSPGVFGEFVSPYLTQAVEITHKHNKKFLLHCCGSVRRLLPQIIDAGVDMLEPIQTRAVGMDPESLKRDFGRDLCFYGGMDLQQILCKGTPTDVVSEVHHLIDILGKDGGYILGPGHTYIQIDAPIENILAMYETAYSYRP